MAPQTFGVPMVIPNINSTNYEPVYADLRRLQDRLSEQIQKMKDEANQLKHENEVERQRLANKFSALKFDSRNDSAIEFKSQWNSVLNDSKTLGLPGIKRSTMARAGHSVIDGVDFRTTSTKKLIGQQISIKRPTPTNEASQEGYDAPYFHNFLNEIDAIQNLNDRSQKFIEEMAQKQMVIA